MGSKRGTYVAPCEGTVARVHARRSFAAHLNQSHPFSPFWTVTVSFWAT